MFDSIRRHVRSIATIGVASALVVGGVAAAQGDSQGGGDGQQARLAPPPMMGPLMKGLTYAELHVQKNGQEQVIRLDQGKITAVDDSSITLSENDGSSVTIALDEDTEVLAGPGHDSSVGDLSVGQTVVVCAPEGAAAKTVIVPPKRGEMKGGFQGGQLPPPPSGSR
jgi:hypothetical protein